GDVHLRRGAGRHAAHPHDVTALDCRCIDRALWRDDYSDLLRRLEAGVWPGASGAHSGRGTDADGPGVVGWAAGLRAVRGGDRLLHAGALDPRPIGAGARTGFVADPSARDEGDRVMVWQSL